jgi:hypothetical protein
VKDPTDPIQPTPSPSGKPKVQPSASDFKSKMEQAKGKGPAGPTEGTSPMEAMQAGTNATMQPTLDTLQNQVQSAQGNLSEIKKKLEDTPNLTIKRQHQTLIKNKLGDAHAHINTANQKLGLQAKDLPELPKDAGPITRFLQYVTDGQNQLVATKQKLQEMSQKGQQLDPTALLLVQVKLSQAQQELEYSSTLLGKVIDIFNRLMQQQI